MKRGKYKILYNIYTIDVFLTSDANKVMLRSNVSVCVSVCHTVGGFETAKPFLVLNVTWLRVYLAMT